MEEEQKFQTYGSPVGSKIMDLEINRVGRNVVLSSGDQVLGEMSIAELFDLDEDEIEQVMEILES